MITQVAPSGETLRMLAHEVTHLDQDVLVIRHLMDNARTLSIPLVGEAREAQRALLKTYGHISNEAIEESLDNPLGKPVEITGTTIDADLRESLKQQYAGLQGRTLNDQVLDAVLEMRNGRRLTQSEEMRAERLVDARLQRVLDSERAMEFQEKLRQANESGDVLARRRAQRALSGVYRDNYIEGEAYRTTEMAAVHSEMVALPGVESPVPDPAISPRLRKGSSPAEALELPGPERRPGLDTLGKTNMDAEFSNAPGGGTRLKVTHADTRDGKTTTGPEAEGAGGSENVRRVGTAGEEHETGQGVKAKPSGGEVERPLTVERLMDRPSLDGHAGKALGIGIVSLTAAQWFAEYKRKYLPAAMPPTPAKVN